MKINRYICIVLIIGSSIFASYYGGNISYALFYLSLLLPFISFLYTLYVYGRFKLYQSIANIVVVKGDWTAYSFVIANEDYITFRNIKVNFLSDKSTIEDAGRSTEYSLLPSESERMSTRIKCNFRGEYSIGVDSVEVTDFLYLFRITYPVSTKLKAIVLPRVVPLETLGIAPPQNDVKNPLGFSNAAEEELDTEVRKYNPGDSRKRIHWKASAKMHELISRKYQHIPKARIAIFMDLSKISGDELEKVVSEDKIIESTLAIANYYAQRRIPSQIIYDMDGSKQITIASREEFNAFYTTCAAIRFQGDIPVSELMKERIRTWEEGMFCITATHLLTKELYMTAMQLVSGGTQVSILLFCDDTSDSTKELIDALKISGVNVYQIMSKEEINDILARGK